MKLVGGKISDSEMEKYIEGWRRRADQARRRMEEQAREAFAAAKRLAGMLAAEPGVRRVWLYESLAGYFKGYRRFEEDSDIDLAVEGLSPKEYFPVLARLNRELERNVDLIDLDACPAALKEAVQERGILLYERPEPAADPCQ